MTGQDKKLCVGFNARLLVEPRARGWNRYTINLLRKLPACGVSLRLYAGAEVHRDYLALLPEGSFTVVVAPPMRYGRWLWKWLPARLAGDGVDVFHAPFNFGLPPRSCCPRVLTLHDAIPQVYARRRSRTWRPPALGGLRSRFDHWLSRRRADRIITVSGASRSDIVRVLGVPPHKVVVIGEAPDDRFLEPVSDDARRSVRQRHGLGGRYIVYVGGWEDRKNVGFLVRALAQARLDDTALVLAGGNDDQRTSLRAQADALGLGDRVLLLGWVDDAELPALMAEALCFVYPSEYEGFGLQLCEAMAVGCPCLAARATSLPEVLGSGGETFTLENTDELAALLRRVAGEAAFRDDLAVRARRRARDFSWTRAAEETTRVYRALIA